MSVLFLALLSAPADAKPLDLSVYKGITVDYTMTTKGTSACSTTFRGTGAEPVVEGGRVTFTGTWVITADTCQGKTVWAAGEGEPAHHTLRLDGKGKAFEEWVVHSKAADHERFSSDIKARGQYWINELEMPAKDGFHYTLTESQGMFPLTVDITHDLKVALLDEAPPAPAPAEEAEAPAEAPPAEAPPAKE